MGLSEELKHKTYFLNTGRKGARKGIRKKEGQEGENELNYLCCCYSNRSQLTQAVFRTEEDTEQASNGRTAKRGRGRGEAGRKNVLVEGNDKTKNENEYVGL